MGAPSDSGRGPCPSPLLEGIEAYRLPRHPAPVDLPLDGNEGALPPAWLFDGLAERAPGLSVRYRTPAALERTIAARFGVDPEQVLACAGADQAIDLVCRCYLAPGRTAVLTEPGFPVFATCARLAGAGIAFCPWEEGPLPLAGLFDRFDRRTGLVVLVSPCNPTGAVVTPDDLRAVSVAAPDALVVLDLAYGEFADRDLTPEALALPNVVVLRTLSKAWGLAGLRIGFALGPAPVIGTLRRASLPYPLSSLSMEAAGRWLEQGGETVGRFVAEVRRERPELHRLLDGLVARPVASEANFVLARPADPVWLRDGLAGLGIGVRLLPPSGSFGGGVRITCPGDPERFERLRLAIEAVLAPAGLLFDMDGVLVDVSRSYRAAIAGAAATYGVELNREEIAAAKAEPGANDDWEVTRRLLERHGVAVPLSDARERFELLYQGGPGRPGLWRLESLRCPLPLLERLARRLPLAIVTGRPRADAARFLSDNGIEGLFAAVVCREDGPLKPDPAPVRRALDLLGIDSAWMAGDTPDDIAAARAAGVVPLGIVSAPDDPAGPGLLRSGAARVLDTFDQLEEMLP